MDLPILDISYKGNHTTRGPVVTGFFHWASRFQGSTMLSHVSVLHSFLWLSNVPWCGYTTYYMSICNPLLSINGCLACFHYGKHCEHSYVNLRGHKFTILLGTYLGVEFLSHMVILCLTIWGTVFQSDCTISRSHRQWGSDFSTSLPIPFIFCLLKN